MFECKEQSQISQPGFPETSLFRQIGVEINIKLGRLFEDLNLGLLSSLTLLKKFKSFGNESQTPAGR